MEKERWRERNTVITIRAKAIITRSKNEKCASFTDGSETVSSMGYVNVLFY